jgi:hypothetical protein
MDSLAVIFAEMVRSALDWEQVNGCPAQISPKDELTGTQKANILPPPVTEEKDDHIDASPK